MNPVNTRSRSNALGSSSDPVNNPVLQGRQRRDAISRRPLPGLEQLMRDGFFFSSFLNFARGEFSGENLEFWRDVEQFKQQGFPTVLSARVIYNKYVAPGSQYEINIRNATRSVVKERLVRLQGIYENNFTDRHALQSVFDEAMVENIQTLSDTYTRFMFAPAYEQCMKQMGYTV